MKINTKITLMVITILSIAMLTTLLVNLYTIKIRGDEDIRNYQEIELAKVKQGLKNYVDIAYATIDSNYKNSQDQAYLQKYYGLRLQSVIDVAETILKSKEDQATAGKLTLAEAQKQAIAEIKQIRYDEGKGYIWINDTGKPYPKMIMHPTLPELDGKILDDPSFNTALGKKENLFVAFVEVCEKNGGDFVDYLWPKPIPGGGLMPDMPKLSYVRLFKGWNWVFGTGIYVDEAVKDGMDKSIGDIKQMRYNNGEGYFWINDTTKPTPRMVMHPTIPTLDDKILNDSKFNATYGKYTSVKSGQNLFEAFAEVCEKEGGGFVDYLWPKPTKTGLTEEQPKMSYVRLHKELGWIVGSGAYIDNIENEVAEQKRIIDEQVKALVYEVSVISVIIILLTLIILHFVLNKYLSRMTGEPQTAPVGASGGVTATQSIRDDYLTLAKELGQTMLAEQTKLLAFTASVQACRLEDGPHSDSNLVSEVRVLASQTSQTVTDLKKMVEIVQKYTEVNTLEIAKINQLIHNVNDRVGQMMEKP